MLTLHIVETTERTITVGWAAGAYEPGNTHPVQVGFASPKGGFVALQLSSGGLVARSPGATVAIADDVLLRIVAGGLAAAAKETKGA